MSFPPQQNWQALSAHLDAVLDLDAAAQADWLSELRQRDPDMAARVAAALDARQGAGFEDFLSGAAPVAVAELAPGSLTGMQIGPYRIEEQIGKGGMGTVWRAHRSDGLLKRAVALKLPNVGLDNQELLGRFSRERAILADLEHPNIARLYDAGFSESGQPYLALEYVPGVYLPVFCDQNRLDIRQRLELFGQVLRAVQHAHNHLVIHRDLKPSNVIVTAAGQAMLLDFGIAKLMDVDPAEDLVKTRIGAVAMTPDYASPEQIAGQPVTTASDIYSLGVLLFELLTGEQPYRLKRTSLGALEEAILLGAPRRPSQCTQSEAGAAVRRTTVTHWSRILRGDLETIVLKAMKKSPFDRYPTADAFLQDIEHYLRNEPVTARADSRWYRTQKFIDRHRWPVAAGVLTVGVIVTAAAVAVVEAQHAAVERDRALALSSRNQAVSGFLELLITEAASAGKPVTVTDMLERSEALVTTTTEFNQDHRAAVFGVLGINYHTLGENKRAEALLARALATAKGSKDRELLAKLACDHALAQGGVGQVADATLELNRVIADPSTSTQQAAECLEDLAYLAQDAGDALNALKYGSLAYDKLQQLEHPPPVLEAAFLGSLGFAQFLNGHNEAAERLYARSLAQFAKAGNDRSANAISVRNNWAIVSDGAGTPRKSLELFEQTLAILAENDPNGRPPPYLLGNRAKSLDSLGRFAESRAAYLECKSEAQKAGAPMSVAFCTLGLANVALTVGDLAEVDGLLHETAEVIPPSAPPRFPARIALAVMRGRLLLARGRLSDARHALDAAVAMAEGGSQLTGALLARAEVGLNDGQWTAALADIAKARTLTETAQGGIPYSNRTGYACLMMARVLAKQGDAQAAARAAELAARHLSNTVDPNHPWLLAARELQTAI